MQRIRTILWCLVFQEVNQLMSARFFGELTRRNLAFRDLPGVVEEAVVRVQNRRLWVCESAAKEVVMKAELPFPVVSKSAAVVQWRPCLLSCLGVQVPTMKKTSVLSQILTPEVFSND